MGTTTFSGPIKAGDKREGASKNTGSVLMAQSAVIDIIGATATSTIGIIPANSQIVDVLLNVTTVNNDGGTATVQVGNSGDFSTAQGTVMIDRKVKKVPDYDTASMILKSKKGILCQLSNSRRQTGGFDQRIDVYCKKGNLNLTNINI